MKTWTHYAFILDGEVVNISPFGVEGKLGAEQYGQTVYGENCKVIDVTNYRLGFGYRYHDDAFWNVEVRLNDDGTETVIETKLEPVPSEEERIEAVESTSTSNTTSIESNTTAIDDILVMLLDDSSLTDDLSGLEDTTA